MKTKKIKLPLLTRLYTFHLWCELLFTIAYFIFKLSKMDIFLLFAELFAILSIVLEFSIYLKRRKENKRKREHEDFISVTCPICQHDVFYNKRLKTLE